LPNPIDPQMNIYETSDILLQVLDAYNASLLGFFITSVPGALTS